MTLSGKGRRCGDRVRRERLSARGDPSPELARRRGARGSAIYIVRSHLIASEHARWDRAFSALNVHPSTLPSGVERDVYIAPDGNA